MTKIIPRSSFFCYNRFNFYVEDSRDEPFDKATFEVVKVIDDGVQTLHPEFTADGAFVYVSDWQGNAIRVCKAETFEKVAEVGGLTTPTGIFNTSRRSETLGH